MLRRILDKTQARILAEERRTLGNLQVALARFGLDAKDQERLEQSIRTLDELFLLVVVGEFNSGKSAFINALLAQPVLEEGVTPTTTRINLLKYGPEVSRTAQGAALDVITAPLDLLQEINIVDTPGTNAIQREHEAITEEFVPRADMVLFVTSADRPFTESERAFLERIRNWGKKVVVILNKIDILESDGQVQEIETFITENARALLGFTPEVFPVSAKQAFRAKQTGDATLLERSRFAALEKYIVDTLDEKERIRLKFSNPLKVGQRLIATALGTIDGRLALLKDDIAAVEDIYRQMETYREDMRRDFRFRLADVENVLHEFENRGMAYFDETIRLARIFDLINKSRLQAEFEREVVGDVPQTIERRVIEVIDWLVAKNLRQWQGVMDHLAERRAVHADRIVGQVGGTFDYDRDRLLQTVWRETQRTIETYDRRAEAEQVADSVRTAVATTALVEVGAIGLGAVLTAVFSTTALDVTGVVAATALAALGLFVIPARRRKAKDELRAKIAALREKLMAALTGQFDRELDRSLSKLEEAIEPYTRFIRSERDHLTKTRQELGLIAETMARLEAEIARL
ncbi:MAG: dynamin family protein [Anaerolineales bacterium]